MDVRRVDSDSAWQQARAIRQIVFVEEQACPPADEWDEHDWPAAHCTHLLVFEGDRPVGTARWRAVTHDGRPAAKLERFAVLPDYRGRGYGKKLVDAALRDAADSGHSYFLLHAQAYLEDFYASFGFVTVGDQFDEVGIPHVTMIRELDAKA